jgi:hypothetical protein
VIDLRDFLTDSGHHSNAPAWWNFEFPSGRAANVWLSNTPFAFDMEVDRSADDLDGMEAFSDQTTEQVRERLTELMSEPAKAAS